MARMRVDNREIANAEIFEILLDSFPDIIHSVGESGRIVFTNRKAETLLGYTRDELLSMNVRQIYAEEVLAKLDTGFTTLKRQGDFAVESILKAKDGTKIPVEIRSFSIYDDSGAFIRTFSILRDIRPIKELQNSLIHASRLAAVGEMASGVAHDINNPLTVIMMSNQMSQRAVDKLAPDAPPDRKLIDRMASLAADSQRASKSIQKLAEHLRNFSRGVAEKREHVDIHTTVADALFMCANKIISTQVQVENIIAKGMHFTVGSPNQLEQVFVNIIANACDAMAGLPVRRINISVSGQQIGGDSFWRCDLEDSGTGIPKEIISQIFESFFTTKEKGKGTGLGLSISRGIVKDHGGQLEVTSEVGKGSTFSIFLLQSDPPPLKVTETAKQGATA